MVQALLKSLLTIFHLSCMESIRSNMYEYDFKRSAWFGDGQFARADHEFGVCSSSDLC